MIGIVLVTHGNLAHEFRDALEHVVGQQDHFASVAIGPDDDMEIRRQEILDEVNKVQNGDGVIVLTDMFGGTPSNLAISIMEDSYIEVIAGVNLPMLVKLCHIRDKVSIKDALEAAQDAGRKYINVASKVLQGR